MRKRTYIYWVFCAGGGQVSMRDIFNQSSITQSLLQDSNSNANNWITGITSDYHSYVPANSKYASVATTRAGSIDPQKSVANFKGLGRLGPFASWTANSSQAGAGANANRISYLTPSASRPTVYHWGQDYVYTDPYKEVFANQTANGLSFYRLSDGNKVVMDQFINTQRHWLFYNYGSLDNNLFNITSIGALSKIGTTNTHQDKTTNPSTPLLFQTHGGIPANNTTDWRTDYPRDAQWQTDDRDTYIWYRPNFGSNVQLPADIETMGEWFSNMNGERSGSKRDKK